MPRDPTKLAVSMIKVFRYLALQDRRNLQICAPMTILICALAPIIMPCRRLEATPWMTYWLFLALQYAAAK